MNAYARSADSYLTQRILSAGPEQQAALLMEAGQRFLGRAIAAIQRKDFAESSRCLIRVTEILNESTCRLNHDEPSELVMNLFQMYQGWIGTVMQASRTKDIARLETVSFQMGEIRQAWEQLHEKNLKAVPASDALAHSRVV